MLSLLSAMLCCVAVSAQHKVEMIPFGNMDQWIDRQIKESGIIGGATKNALLRASGRWVWLSRASQIC